MTITQCIQSLFVFIFTTPLFWFMFEVGFFLVVFMIKFEKNILLRLTNY